MKRSLVFGLAACCGLIYAQGQSPADGNGPPEINRHKIKDQNAGAPTAGSAGIISPNIRWHGGPVMGMPTPYLIWYGNWAHTTGSDSLDGQQIVRDFIHGLNGSNYYATNASYVGVSGALNVGGLGNRSNGSQEINDAYSQGTSLSDNAITSIVSRAIGNGLGPAGGDTNGIYMVLTSSDVNETSGFCTQYCGWHTFATLGGKSIKYAFVGNANRCLNACAAQTVSPNGNAGVDGMISVVAHEMEETNTDPLLNAWYNNRGSEDADMCAWTFGSHQTQLPTGAWYNVTLPGISTASRNYLIQRELDVNSKCYIDYAKKLQ
jgi:Phosphate-induced protein 1 conserved region